jgi:ABC-type multidrug transport system permease subunit
VTDSSSGKNWQQRLNQSPLIQLVLARLRAFYREPSVLFWVFGFPILLSIALGIAFRNQPPAPVEVAVLEGPRAYTIVSALNHDRTVRLSVLSDEEARRHLRTGKVSLVVVAGATAEDGPLYRYDAQRPEARLARAVVDDRLQRAYGRKDVVFPTEQLIKEPGSRYIDFLLPGLLGANLMSGGLWGVGYALVELRTRKLLKRLVATPMRKGQFLLSFLIGRIVLLVFEIPILLGFAWLSFDIKVRGSISLFVLVAVLGSLSFAGLGLLLASRARNTQTVSGLMNLATLPMYLLSGVFFSSNHFPNWLKPAISVLPLTALNDGLRAVMIDGTGWTTVAIPVMVLAAWASVTFMVAIRLFRWR